ncbi:hypothetical protein CBR_g66761 [Chara braunii]|uniref:peptidylprolyl isomerase n=1 Tax=Chara braunii TaxID=69332 RepID=A0A388K997_CHABU|nr:hypothetical protein CBR_g66761 [Chara braunii]|eukprot:GBG66625.1 hypothetical protein CBR_g66761 [Chara braunii]
MEGAAESLGKGGGEQGQEPAAVAAAASTNEMPDGQSGEESATLVPGDQLKAVENGDAAAAAAAAADDDDNGGRDAVTLGGNIQEPEEDTRERIGLHRGLRSDESEEDRMPEWKWTSREVEDQEGIVVVSEGVIKEVIKQGVGDTPPRNATCTVNFRAWILETKQKVLDTREDRESYELSFGHERRGEKGLSEGISSMRAGEKCLLRVKSDKAYGREGNFSFPHVPPDADLLYEVELVGFDILEEGKHRSLMTVEERCEAAEKRRQLGNELFQEGKFEEAAKKYEMALSYMGEEFMFQLEGKYRDLANKARLPCHLNLAACYIKLKRHEEAIQHCNTVLMEDATNEKALYRRGLARLELDQTDAAREDFVTLSKLAPNDPNVAKKLRAVKEQEAQVRRKQRQLYKGMFPPPKPRVKPWYTRLWLRLVAILLSILAILLSPLKRWRQKVKMH